jgi:hypothetical protein
MPVHNFFFPVIPGEEDLARQFAKEVLSDHADDYASLMKESGTTRVTRTLQETPAGSFILVWYEAAEVLKIFEILAARDDAAAWTRGRVEECGGIQLSGPPPGPGPELILEWLPA